MARPFFIDNITINFKRACLKIQFLKGCHKDTKAQSFDLKFIFLRAFAT